MKKLLTWALPLLLSATAYAQTPSAATLQKIEKETTTIEKQAEDLVISSAEFFAMPALMQDLCGHDAGKKKRFQAVLKGMRKKMLEGHTDAVGKQFDDKFVTSVSRLRAESKSVPEDDLRGACESFNKQFDGELQKIEDAIKVHR